MKVFVVHTEWGEPADGSCSVIEGVFATKEAAEACRRDTIKTNADFGRVPYISADGVENPHWDFDVMVEEQEVK